MAAPDCLLIVSPHADDEVLGAPSLVLAARDAGWRAVNLLCFLKPEQRERRSLEAQRAARELDIELRIAGEPLLSATARTDPERTRSLVTAAVTEVIEETCPTIILSPGPHDMHPAHEAMADGVRRALEATRPAPRWLIWAWWGELPIVNTLALYDEAAMDRAQRALAAHRGELARLDLSAALDARSRWNAAVGPERVNGPGHRTTAAERAVHADVLLELGDTNGTWRLAEPRVAPAAQLLAPPQLTARDLTAWLDSPSPSYL